MTRRVDNIYLYTGDLQLVYHKKRILRYRVFFNYVDKILTTYLPQVDISSTTYLPKDY